MRQLEQLAQSDGTDETEVRRVLREVSDQWRKSITESGLVPAPIDARFKRARTGVEELLRGRSRLIEAAVWADAIRQGTAVRGIWTPW